MHANAEGQWYQSLIDPISANEGALTGAQKKITTRQQVGRKGKPEK